MRNGLEIDRPRLVSAVSMGDSRYHWDHSNQIRRFDQNSMPEQISVELSGHCNLNCLKCNIDDLKRPKGYMTRELYLKIIQDETIGKIERLGLSNMGEPLMHKNLSEFVELADKTGKFKRIHITTNAILLNERVSKRLLDAGLGGVKLSLDFLDRESYKKYNERDHFNKVVKNIQTFCDLKKRGRYNCDTMLKVTLYDYTEEVAQELIDRWKGYVDSIRISNVHGWAGAERGNIPAEERKSPCQYLFCTLHILHDGRVTLCCYDKEGYLSVANIKDHSVAEMWKNHPRLNEIRQSHLDGDFSDLQMCRTCDSESYDDLVRYPD